MLKSLIGRGILRNIYSFFLEDFFSGLFSCYLNKVSILLVCVNPQLKIDKSGLNRVIIN
jgi:hypothetical protein